MATGAIRIREQLVRHLIIRILLPDTFSSLHIKKMRKKLKRIISTSASPFKAFFALESSSALLLMTAALLGFIMANSPWSAIYFTSLDHKIGPLSALLWINDGLMAVFFFVVGLEIKRELISGELSSLKKASLPLFGALGGMIFPALIYLFFNHGTENATGWAIPMATDIAFAAGLLGLLGPRIPKSLKIFLLALAIADDLGAVIVIAFFYTQKINFVYLASALLLLAPARYLALRFSQHRFLFVILAILIWTGFLLSGVHATIAGVLLGFIVPAALNDFDSSKQREILRQPIDQWIHILHPFVAFLIMPLFGLANSGVKINSEELPFLVGHPVTLGVAFGLFLGKPFGIYALTRISTILKWAHLPPNVSQIQLLGCAWIAGIGFTMSLFINQLAFTESTALTASKFGIIIGSLGSAAIGVIILKMNRR